MIIPNTISPGNVRAEEGIGWIEFCGKEGGELLVDLSV